MFTVPMSLTSGLARLWKAARKLAARLPLRVKLITAVLALVVVALSVISFASVSFLGGYMMSQPDAQLQSPRTEHDAYNWVHQYLTGSPGRPTLGEELSVTWLPSDGSPQTVITPVTPRNGFQSPYGKAGPRIPYSASHTISGPDLPSVISWLATAANPEQPVTVPAASGGGHWRIAAYAESYPSLSSPDGTQTGVVVVGVNVNSIYQTLGHLTDIDAVVSVVVLVVLAMIGAAVVRANLRPLDEIEETAEQIAAGHLDRRVPDRDPRTEVGSLGRSINVMLAQIESGYRARQDSEAAARQSEERMRQFIADASHELRTPLTALRGFAEYYRQRRGPAGPDEGLTPEELDRIMQRVEEEAARMGVLVEDLLLLARLDQQRPLDRQPVDMLVLAADAVQDTRMIAPERPVHLDVERGAAFLVEGDEVRLRQVIGNLMSNALKYTPEGSPIDVRVGPGVLGPGTAGPGTAGPGTPAGSRGAAPAAGPGTSAGPAGPVPAVFLEVADQGPGLTPEQAERVFERFYRADKARARKTGGSGLGLAIVNALVSAHGGTATVRSAPGHGAAFRITLPLAADARHAQDLDEDEEPDTEGLDAGHGQPTERNQATDAAADHLRAGTLHW